MSNWYKDKYVDFNWHKLSESGKYPDSLNDKIWRMFGVNLNTGENVRHPDKEPYSKKTKKKDICDCSHSMDMHCDGGDDGW